jgi:hypothetical protein
MPSLFNENPTHVSCGARHVNKCGVLGRFSFPLVVDCRKRSFLIDQWNFLWQEAGAVQFSIMQVQAIRTDLRPSAHPATGRVLTSFEPVRLADATGWGVEPSV